MKVNSALVIACAVLLGLAVFLLSRRVPLEKTGVAVDSHRQKIAAKRPEGPVVVPSAPVAIKEELSRPGLQADSGNSVQKPLGKSAILQTNPPPVGAPKKSVAFTRRTPGQKDELKDP